MSIRSFLKSAFSILLLAFLPGMVQAQISVSPTILEEKAYPGGVVKLRLGLANTSDEPLYCTISVSAMEVQGDGLPVAVPDAPRSCHTWISFGETDFALAPKQGKSLLGSVRVPRDASGGYYAVIACHGKPPQGIENGGTEGVKAGIRFSYRVMAVVLLTVPGANAEALIDAASPMLELQENKNSYLFQLPVRNRGNMHVRIAGKVEIRSEAGQILEDFTLTAGKGFLLPGHERVFRNEMQTSLPDGFYVAKVDLHREGHTQPMTNNFAFYVEAGEPKVGELSDEIRARLDKQSAGFTVTPGETTVSLRPGARRMQAVTLTNLTRDTFTVRARPAEWVRNIDGRDLVMDGEASHGHSASGWIDVRSPEITLRPLGKSRVPLFVSLPKEAIGEGYAAVAFNRDGVNLDDSPAERSRRSARLRVIAEGSGVRSAEIEAFESARLPNGAFEFILRFRNTGALGLFPDVSISILDKDSNQAGRITLPDVRNRLYQAGQTGEARAQYNQILDPGDYTASLNFAYSDTQPAVSRRTTFTVPEVTAPSETAAAD